LSSELVESVGSAEPPPKPVYTAPSEAVDAAPSPVAVAVMDVIVDVLILVGSWAPHGLSSRHEEAQALLFNPQASTQLLFTSVHMK
jgi:hypothetical protein